jgi:SAM-dependent methyltransferase
MAAFLQRLRSRARRERDDARIEIPDWTRRRAVAETSFVPWIDRVFPLAGRTVLEYGCGNGAVAAAFAPHVGCHVGVDIDAGAVEQGNVLLAQDGLDPTLQAVPLDEITAVVEGMQGDVDLFLCYAVLEHMTVAERLELLAVAQRVVRPDGAIAIVETPNRLLPWDYHTAQLPFYSQLPDELAIRYRDRSPRAEFIDALDAAEATSDSAVRDALTRWGRGMSYHELELAFEDFAARTLATSWELELLRERNIHLEELALQATLDEVAPSLPPSCSRYWLDIVLAASPVAERPPLIRPWTLRTVDSPGCEYDRGVVQLPDPASARLAIDLPQATRRLVIGAQSEGDAEITVTHAETGEQASSSIPPGAHGPGYDELRFETPGQRYELRLAAPGCISFVGYEW